MIQAALALSNRLARSPWRPIAPSGRRRTRWFAIGDLQTSLVRVLEVLDGAGLLGPDGTLEPDVGLISVGDHFDYPGADDSVGRQGMRVLRWLAQHPPDQVIILAGNHDLTRVSELAYETDETFARARALARQILAARRNPALTHSLKLRFVREFPRIPIYNIAARDYVSFSEAQRALVSDLLTHGRMVVACSAQLPGGAPLLITHAGVTHRQLAQLGLADVRDVTVIADRLNEWFAQAVARVSDRWARGELAALDLRPVHVAGTSGCVGGGLLYHRPAQPGRRGGNDRWEFDPVTPRRFDPRTLPLGVVQACGHTGHRKCVKELGDWVADSARAIARGGLRTLRTDGTHVTYEGGVNEPAPGEATLYMIDAEIHHVATEQYPLLQLAGLGAPGVQLAATAVPPDAP